MTHKGLLTFILAVFFALPLFVYAGTINSTNKYARFLDSSFGLINFGTADGSVVVGDSTLSGYAWGEYVGWINLSPAGSGVLNNGAGVLSGYAWGENTGWINFNPTNGGVTIDSSGDFQGYAWSEMKGWIVFNCATDSTCGTLSHKVKTDWAPASPTPTPPGGGIIPSPPPKQPLPPVVNPPFTPPPEEGPAPVPENNNETENPSSQNENPGISDGGFGGGSGGGSGDGGTSESPGHESGGAMGFFADIQEYTKDKMIRTVGVAQEIKEEVKKILETPEGEATSKTLTTTGVVSISTVSLVPLFFTPFSLSEFLFLLPLRLWGLLLVTLGIKRRHRPWGAVYDSITKQPIDPAYVVLETLGGENVATAITDLDGRYGFLVPPGTYRIKANKTNYAFPSTRLIGKKEDEFYHDLYFGDIITLREGETILARDIPMDPKGFDWNEYAKRTRHLMGFYSRNTILIERFSRTLFVVGFLITCAALIANPEPYNITTFILYIFLWMFRKIGPEERRHGVVIEKETGSPAAFSFLKVSYPGSDAEVRKSVADVFGRYYCLVTKGVYNVDVVQRKEDGSYAPAEFKATVRAPRGIIREKFEV